MSRRVSAASRRFLQRRKCDRSAEFLVAFLTRARRPGQARKTGASIVGAALMLAVTYPGHDALDMWSCSTGAASPPGSTDRRSSGWHARARARHPRGRPADRRALAPALSRPRPTSPTRPGRGADVSESLTQYAISCSARMPELGELRVLRRARPSARAPSPRIAGSNSGSDLLRLDRERRPALQFLRVLEGDRAAPAARPAAVARSATRSVSRIAGRQRHERRAVVGRLHGPEHLGGQGQRVALEDLVRARRRGGRTVRLRLRRRRPEPLLAEEILRSRSGSARCRRRGGRARRATPCRGSCRTAARRRARRPARRASATSVRGTDARRTGGSRSAGAASARARSRGARMACAQCAAARRGRRPARCPSRSPGSPRRGSRASRSHAPRSISLQRSLQNGRNGEAGDHSTGRWQVGQGNGRQASLARALKASGAGAVVSVKRTSSVVWIGRVLASCQTRKRTLQR